MIASGSSGNCYRVDDGDSAILLDAGISIKRIRVGCNFGLSSVAGCLVTHSHSDHCKSVPDLLKAGVSVYMPQKEIEAMNYPTHHRLKKLVQGELGSYKPFSVGDYTVVPFRTEHDTPEPVGYFIASGKTGERLLYFTDTYYLSNRFSGVTHIIGEVNYNREEVWRRIDEGETEPARAKRLFSTHMSLENFLDFLRANDLSRLRQIFICHMSDDHGNEKTIKESVQRLTGVEVYVC